MGTHTHTTQKWDKYISKFHVVTAGKEIGRAHV